MQRLIQSLEKIENAGRNHISEEEFSPEVFPPISGAAKKRVDSIAKKMNQVDASIMLDKSVRISGAIPEIADLHDGISKRKEKFKALSRDMDSVMWTGYTDELSSHFKAMETELERVNDLLIMYLVVQQALRQKAEGGKK